MQDLTPIIIVVAFDGLERCVRDSQEVTQNYLDVLEAFYFLQSIGNGQQTACSYKSFLAV